MTNVDAVNKAIDQTIGKEGGYSNNPNDTGGATMWGITQKVARAHGYVGDMRYLPRNTAISIYEADYWTGPRFDQVAEVSQAVAIECFDTGVNMGPSVPAKFLQRWLTALNNQGKLYPDLTADGMIGPRTISALKSFIALRGKKGEQALVKALNCSQGARYLELAESRPANEEFIYGWLERVEC